jgi:hypothetical protein
LGDIETGAGRGGLSPDNCRANEPGNLSIRQSRGLPARPRQLPKTAVLVVSAILLGGAVAGCSGGEGVESGATVTAYVAAPLCAGAKKELVRSGGEAGDLQVRAICLPSDAEGGKLDLATVGANARRATEDSTTVAYLEPPEPRTSRFTHPILETAKIPSISNSSGKAGMAHLLSAIERAGDSGNLRESVGDELE